MLRDLHSFAADTYSQFGEDGIIAEILDRIAHKKPANGWCVEFGAWDGVHLSNTCKLIRESGYSAVLIEGDPARVRDMAINHPQENVHKICTFVSFEGNSRLSTILAGTPIPEDFDVLSIDIDGCDYWILQSFRGFRPKVIIIEYNPTIPNAVDYIQARNFRVKQGTSARSLTTLADSMDYALVACTKTNLIFVDRPYEFAAVGKERVNQGLDAIRDDSDCQVFLFTGQDGTVLTSRPLTIPWHGTSVTQESLQVVPRFFRTFPGDWPKSVTVLWAAFRTLRGKRFSRGVVRSPNPR